MTREAFFTALTASLIFLNSCGTMPTDIANEGYGSIDIRAWVNNGLSKSVAAKQTTWDSLVVTVTGADMAETRSSTKFNGSEPCAMTTLEGIPAGESRIVTVWTCTKPGDTIHFGCDTIAKIGSGEIVPVVLDLVPVQGSIYINLANVPTSVDSVHAEFCFDSTTLRSSKKRAALMYLSIDNVPDGAEGVLTVCGKDASGAVLYSDTLDIVFRSTRNASLQATFLAKQGGLSLDLTVDLPGVTVVVGAMTGEQVLEEVGPLVITEILYYADGDSDFIEITNAGQVTVQLDTLVLEVVNTSSVTTKYIENVSLLAGERFVIGDTDCPQAWCDTTVAMDLTTTGRWIILKHTDGTVIDHVSYTKTVQEWPTAVKYQSIELDPGALSPELNNYGRNWSVSTTPIAGTPYYATPGE